MSGAKLARLAQIEKATRIAKPAAPSPKSEEPLSEEAKTLPEHIIQCTEPRKLNAQTPIFRCPEWAGLPEKSWHLRCTREQTVLPSLALHRYPFFLLGKNPICDYVLEHASVSSFHAVLVFHKQQACFVLLDLGSTNGTRVNGKPIPAQRPVPMPAGTVVQFGYSSRRYELRTGAPPQRSRDDGNDVANIAPTASKDESAASVRTTNTDTADSHKRPREDDADTGGEQRKATSNVEQQAANHAPEAEQQSTTAPTTIQQETEAHVPPAAEEPKPADEPMHFYHLVIKHNSVRNAVSQAARNKGEVITRSKQDALEVANFILQSHAERSTSEGYDKWTVEDFIDAVEAYSELAKGKGKKLPGDLGIITRGTLSDEFENAAFALRREEVSQPVETPLGIHLIYRCD